MRPAPRSGQAGFSLVEIMIALAILGLGLTVLLGSVAASSRQGPEVQLMSVATSLARGKMLDLEEQLMKEGFLETDQSSDGEFDAEGWPNISWTAKVEIVELPSMDTLMAMQQAAAGQGSGSAGDPFAAMGSALAGLGSGDGGEPSGDEVIGNIFSLVGGGVGGEGDGASAATGAVAGLYPQLQEVFKASLRRVTLTVAWTVGGRERSFDTVAFFTDPAGMTKTIGELGAAPPADAPPEEPK
jgi:general secretion pathway protein I